MESFTKAQELITFPCLIAADIDNTLLKQGHESERKDFLKNLAPELVRAASGGTNLAVITGNSLDELSKRFLNYLLTHLETNKEIELLSKFHFFCNSGGIHFNFDKINLAKLGNSGLNRKIYYPNSTLIKSEFINWEYIHKTKISNVDIDKINNILTIEWEKYSVDLIKNLNAYKKEYYINESPPEGSDSIEYPIDKVFESRKAIDIRYLNYEGELKSTVQITLKPILSWKHAIEPQTKINNDRRSEILTNIHKKLDEAGLSNYSARVGGSSSIDITKSKLDKSYAIRYLIDYLGIEGNERKGQKLGSNVLYLGDEVISGGGNDYPVTKIDGIMVLALNSLPKYVPFKSRVIVPSELTGPDAAAQVLSEYNTIVRSALPKWGEKINNNIFPNKNAIQLFKEKWFTEKIRDKIDKTIFYKYNLSTEELQVLYTFVTLIYRNDVSAKKWTNILVNELDMIMEALDDNETERLSGIGSSYPKEF